LYNNLLKVKVVKILLLKRFILFIKVININIIEYLINK